MTKHGYVENAETFHQSIASKVISRISWEWKAVDPKEYITFPFPRFSGFRSGQLIG